MIEKKPSIKIVTDMSKVDTEILGLGAALYVRVTREESIKQGLSIPNQKNRGLEVAALREWNWVKVYVEPRHVGGDCWTDKRAALRELVEDLKTGKIKRVFARHHDRFWRDSEVRDRMLKIFREYDIEFWDFDGIKDYLTASGKFALKVQGDASEYEKDITGERIREMKRGKAKAGKPGGGPPTYGYTSQSRLRREIMAKENLDEEGAYKQAVEVIPNAHEWYPDLEEAEVVIVILALYSFRNPEQVSAKPLKEYRDMQRMLNVFQKTKGPAGTRTIANILNANGYRRRSGEPWVGSKVLRVINDPVIYGFVGFDETSYEKKKPASLPKHKQTLYKGQHEPIINPILWKEVQVIKAQRTVCLRTKRTSGRVFPLSRLIYCSRCGSPMKARSLGKSRPFAYYVCRKRSYNGTDVTNNHNACDFPTINVAQAEHAVWDWLLELLNEPEHIVEFMDRTNGKLKQSQPKARLLQVHKKKELVRVQQNIEKYYYKYENASSAVEEELAWDKLVSLKNEMKQLKEELAYLEQELSNTEQPTFSEREVKRYLKGLKAFLLSNKHKRRFLYQLLHAKHEFKVIARGKYCIEPRINLTYNPRLIEIDPQKYPSSESQDDYFLVPELAYVPQIALNEVHRTQENMAVLPNQMLAYRYAIS